MTIPTNMYEYYFGFATITTAWIIAAPYIHRTQGSRPVAQAGILIKLCGYYVIDLIIFCINYVMLNATNELSMFQMQLKFMC